MTLKRYRMKKTVLLLLIGCISASAFPLARKHEMRAVWIATVANIDWPSKPGLAPSVQKEEMVQLLDYLSKANINTIVMQIRPTADAFYPSALEPWSHWLTGTQGEKPSPFYDPLAFIIEEAHRRCIEVHVWLNPYRVMNSNRPELLHPDHLYFRRPELFVRYGNQLYFNPGLDETRQSLNRVVEDIVQRYDVDAIHFDDYFYPYKVAGEDFPDDDTFRKNPRGFAAHERDDWRRNNVDLIIRELQHTIKSNKPWVEFGISPFGVWRNNTVDPAGSATRAGVQNYDDLYADILKWLREGWIDYVAPQLYWEIGKEVADYAILVKWWNENAYGKNLYIGLYASKLGNEKADPAWQRPNELARQLRLNQQYSGVDGAIFFSARGFMKNLQGLTDSLATDFYRYPAINPVNRSVPGEASASPANLRIVKDRRDRMLMWDPVAGEEGKQIAYYVVYAFKGKKPGNIDDPSAILIKTTKTYVDLTLLQRKLKGNYTFIITSVNRFRRESTPIQAITRRI